MPEDGLWDGDKEGHAEPRRTRMLGVAPASLGGLLFYLCIRVHIYLPVEN